KVSIRRDSIILKKSCHFWQLFLSWYEINLLMYDIIGDVHGHAMLLKEMLLKLGYTKTASGYAHPDRKAVYVGDFINRGPHIRKTIKIIRTMVENNNAYAILGNHEINSIISHIKNKQSLFSKND